jgi:hypothetical protein
MFDLAKLDTLKRSEQGVDFIIRHPSTGAPMLKDDGKTPLSIRLLGSASEKARATQRALNQRNAAAASRNVQLTDEDLKAQRTEYMSAITLGWNIDKLDGQDFPFTPENTQELWSSVRWEWMVVQAYNFVFQAGNFLPL